MVASAFSAQDQYFDYQRWADYFGSAPLIILTVLVLLFSLMVGAFSSSK